MPDHKRHIRSFVRRDSRVTKAQAAALENYLDKYQYSPNSEDLSPFTAVNLEIGAGDGQCTLGLSLSRPAAAWVAAEVYRAGLGRLVNAIEEGGLSNVRVADEDIVSLMTTIPTNTFNTIMIFFPDPWPKKKHHKRRLVNEVFLERLAPLLKRSGRLFLATDIEDYAEQMLGLIDASQHWHNLSGAAKWAARPKFRVLTKFEAKGLTAGRKIYDVMAARK